MSRTVDVAGEPREALGLGSRALPLVRAPCGQGHESLTVAATIRKIDQREEVLALPDRERVERRREVPVGEQEAGDGGAERGPEAADRRDHDHGEQVEQEDAREAELVAELREHHGQRGRTSARERPAPAITRRPRQRGRPPADGPLVGVPAAWLITWTSMSAPDSRITRPMTEPCRSSASGSGGWRRARSASRSSGGRCRRAPCRRRRRRRRGTCRPARSTSVRWRSRVSAAAARARPAVARGPPRGRPSRAGHPCGAADQPVAVGSAGERRRGRARASPTDGRSRGARR